ncbi:DUF1638 domain-containing protein [Candidatus Methanomassiliicoccus intestinalis]|uniref:DUF1638 domain-containing protein n=1 Tax=Candidatus Methanomassiliicoccus intestinalis TaxID=1406512 RepID=UPI0037DCE714
MRLGVVACDILKKEIEHLLGDDPDFVRKEYLEFSLHVYPEEMKAKILEVIDDVKKEVDGILIGYAICQALENFTDELDIPAVMIEGVDCIEAVLGPEEYKNEKKKCTGTWFSTPGWAETGKEGLIKEMHLDAMADEGYPADFFLDVIFESYSRCLYIDTGIEGNENYQALSEKFAEELGFQHECRKGSIEGIGKAIQELKTKVAAGS